MNELPEYQLTKTYQDLLKKAKRDYLKHLISLGYVFEQQGMYESLMYWAIHKDYYKIPDDRWEDDFEGTSCPEYFPKGAFIVISTAAESETESRWDTEYFLYENQCNLKYLEE